MTKMAISKIKKELAETKGDRYVGVVKKPVADALIEFCKQDAEFAQSVVQQDKTLSDCLKIVTSGCGNAISDIAAYRKAVQFYFPGADVRMKMSIDLCASVNETPERTTGGKPADKIVPKDDSNIILDLTDFL